MYSQITAETGCNPEKVVVVAMQSRQERLWDRKLVKTHPVGVGEMMEAKMKGIAIQRRRDGSCTKKLNTRRQPTNICAWHRPCCWKCKGGLRRWRRERFMFWMPYQDSYVTLTSAAKKFLRRMLEIIFWDMSTRQRWALQFALWAWLAIFTWRPKWMCMFSSY